jgi:c-di-GMP-binding flagellar brake protein YcgR
MIRFLAEMDRKLDAVLGLLQREALAQEFPEEGHIVELSGQGLVLECNAELSTDCCIELLIKLEEYPIRIVSTLSRVERPRPVVILPDVHSYAYDVSYTSITEEDREAVIRFVFSEERKRIRQSKGEG